MFLQHTEDRARGGVGREIYMVRTALAALEQHSGHILFSGDLYIKNLPAYYWFSVKTQYLHIKKPHFFHTQSSCEISEIMFPNTENSKSQRYMDPISNRGLVSGCYLCHVL